MKSSLSSKRCFLPPGYRIEFRASIEMQSVYLPELVDAGFRELLGPLVLDQEPIVNLKGRDQRNVIDLNMPATIAPSSDEFCFVGGSICRSPRDPKGHDFSVALNSKFIANEESHHMLHVCEIERRVLPDWVDVKRIGRLPGLCIKVFRLGIDVFDSRYLSSLIGLVPTVSQTLLVEATPAKCEISVIAEGLKSKSDTPLQRSELWDRLQRILLRGLHYELQADYNEKLAGQS
jgi:hypothetical protein